MGDEFYSNGLRKWDIDSPRPGRYPGDIIWDAPLQRVEYHPLLDPITFMPIPSDPEPPEPTDAEWLARMERQARRPDSIGAMARHRLTHGRYDICVHTAQEALSPDPDTSPTQASLWQAEKRVAE
jgi:hypothetical protein